MPTKQLQYLVEIEAKRAREELRRLEEETAQFGIASTRAGESLTRAADGGSRFASSADNMGSKMRKAEPVIGKVATGVSGLSGAMHGATGQTNAMTGALANMAGAFAGGGLIAVGIAAATVAVGLLIEKFTKAKDEAKKLQEEFSALDPNREYGKEVVAITEQLRLQNAELATGGDKIARAGVIAAQNVQAIQKSNEKIKRLRQEELFEKNKLKDIEGSILQRIEGAVDAQREKLKAATDLVNAEIEERDLLVTSLTNIRDAVPALEEQLALNKRLTEEQEKRDKAADERKKAALERVAVEQNALNEMVALAKEEQAEKDENLARDIARDRKIAEERDALAKEDQARFEERERMEDERVDRLIGFEIDLEKAADARRKKEEADDEKRQRAHDDYFKARREQEEALAQLRAEKAQEGIDLAMQATSVGISTTNQLMHAVITGQQDSIAELLAGQMTSIGTQVQGIGVKYLAEGLGMNAVLPGSGVAAVGVGLGAIATGTAMAGGGMAFSHIASGGTLGQASGGTSGGGVGRVDDIKRSRGMTSGGQAGGQVVHNYHFSGGVFAKNDSAMGMAQLSRRAQDRLLEPAR